MTEKLVRARDQWDVESIDTSSSFGTCHCMIVLRDKTRNRMVMVHACRSGEERISSLCDRRETFSQVEEQVRMDLDLPLDEFSAKYGLETEPGKRA